VTIRPPWTRFACIVRRTRQACSCRFKRLLSFRTARTRKSTAGNALGEPSAGVDVCRDAVFNSEPAKATRLGNNPSAEPGALPSLAPQRGRSATERKSGRDLRQSSSLNVSAPERPAIPRVGAWVHNGEDPTAGTVKPWQPPRQSRGPPSGVSKEGSATTLAWGSYKGLRALRAAAIFRGFDHS
jgi:hypothetical protein